MYIVIYIYTVFNIQILLCISLYVCIYKFHIFKICGERIQSALLAFLRQCMEHGHDPIQRRISRNPAPLNPRRILQVSGVSNCDTQAQSGWWFFATPLKNMKVSWDDDIPNI